ncbi:acyltransferase family protein [Streptomyces sp. B1I3]|uniref:acyltransferase family protein n=1 Tax=Streptomyces sp. B1I3 TaxID=3042264 RepID=UPI00278457A2|nr:acyltransferase family protein [Streptomyces sp. B1I3]MDQ0792930.1 peptidoglycan/LPS O-acetylase OafA/YrhL [Streptomyces sp. B1I3]
MGGAHRRTALAPSPAAVTGTGGRDRSFDVLRAVALVRVVSYHTFEWPWLGFVFPSMGVMFALAGSLMARSLERPAPGVLRSRLRRLLIPVWLFGLLLGAAMLLHGWVPGPDALYWVFPVGDPPGNAWGEQAWAVLWYLRAYLWFVLLSPLLLRLFRLAPLAALALALVPVAVLETVTGVPEGRLGNGLSDLSAFLFCWLLGFAHRDGVLDRLRRSGVLAAGVALMVAGTWWAVGHPVDGTVDLDGIPLAQALWSAGFVLLLLRCRPRFGALARHPVADRAVTVFNARAVTVYLWHEVALMAAVPVVDLMWEVPALERHLALDSLWVQFGVAWVLVAVAVLCFGWVEDVAAGRRPRLVP